MSDSEDDIAFESADEGEDDKSMTRKHSSENKSKHVSAADKKFKNKVVSESVEKKDNTSESTSVDKTIENMKENDSVLSEPVSTEIDRTKNDCTSSKDSRDNPENVMTPGEKARSVLDKLASEEENSWSSWGKWGTSLFSTATSSVTTFTGQVGEGFNTVLETVDAALAVPSPEDMARADQLKEHDMGDSEEEAEKIENEMGIKRHGSDSEHEGGWLDNWGISGISHAIQDTGKNLVTGSLDVLETIGKKTYDALNEGDPGLQKTKSIFSVRGNKPNLSQALREAKEQADRDAEQEKEFIESRKSNFGAMFDEYQGLAHLEALEMLSNDNEGKVQSLLGTVSEDDIEELKDILISIKKEFEDEEEEESDDEEEHDFISLVTEQINKLNINMVSDKLIKAHTEAREWLTICSTNQDSGERIEAKEIHQEAIQRMALITALSVEHFHKSGELILANKNSCKNFIPAALNLHSLTKTLCAEVAILSIKYSDCLNTAADDSENPDEVQPMITSVYLEATNSSTYMTDAFHLLLPVLQLAALNAKLS